jgi:phage baseplate assembly protein W
MSIVTRVTVFNQITGIKWPFSFESGRVRTSSNDAHIIEIVFQIIGINKGEYLLKPDIGSWVGARIFDPVNIAALADSDIKSAVGKYEPRVSMKSTKIDQSKYAEGIVGVLLECLILGNTELTQVEVLSVNFGAGGSTDPNTSQIEQWIPPLP